VTAEDCGDTDTAAKTGSKGARNQISAMVQMTPFKYGGYWDVPRYILLRYRGKLLLLLSEFDEELDEYPDEYLVYLFPGTDEDSLPPLTLNLLTETPKTQIGRIAIKDVVFDPTRRQELDASCFDGILGGS
jgi:hypothetical protein